MSFTETFPYVYYEGVGSSSEVPDRFDVALNGRSYMLDTTNPAFTAGSQTIPYTRQQADNSPEPGESTRNPEDLWFRGQSSWHLGAGQEYLDDADSVRTRFWNSLGVDPWTRGQLNLLHTTVNQYSSGAGNVQAIRAGEYVYVVDGNALKFAPSPYTGPWGDSDIQNGDAPQGVQSIVSDGTRVYAALGSNGVHVTNKGATSSTHLNDLSCTLLGYAKGRLMAANGNTIYNITTSPGAPTALLVHPNASFSWVGFTEGPGFIYAAGYAGDKSLIYRTAVKADGTNLDVPVVAGELPDGEIVTAIQGYLGFMVVGTSQGFRLSTINGDGNLILGPLVKTGSTVRSFEPQDRFVWFGWENKDSTHTGLGRMDLSVFATDNVPAYATDLMAENVQGAVTSILTEPNGRRMFTVQGQGLFYETGTNVSSGYLESGKLSYGIPDPKIALRFALKHKPLLTGGSIDFALSADEGPYVTIGSSNVVGSTSPDDPLKLPETTGQLFGIRLQLNGPSTCLERYDLRAYPASSRGTVILVPLMLREKVVTGTGDEATMDVAAEYALLNSYPGQRRLISYQEYSVAYSVFVEEVQFQRQSPTSDRRALNGTAVCKLKVLGD